MTNEDHRNAEFALGVPPDRTSDSATETAEAEVTVAFIVTHADGTTTKGPLFEFGPRAFETQFLLGPGHFENVAQFQALGINAKTSPLFDSFKDNGDRFDPRFSLDSVSANIKLGTLEPGDTVSYVYQLTAEGTTHGGEQGFVAFLGDPFGLDIVTGNLVPSATAVPGTAVPEPATWVLLMVGLGCVVGLAHRRATRQPGSAAL